MSPSARDVESAPLPIVVPRRRWPSASIAAMASLMIVIGVSILADEGLRPSSLQIDVSSELGRVLGGASVLVGVVGLLLSVRPLVSRGPAVVIDDQGLTIGAELFGPPLRLRWEEVSGAIQHVPAGRSSGMVVVQLVDPGAFVEGLTGSARLLARLRRRNGLSPALLPGYLLAASTAAVAGRIHAETMRRRA